MSRKRKVDEEKAITRDTAKQYLASLGFPVHINDYRPGHTKSWFAKTKEVMSRLTSPTGDVRVTLPTFFDSLTFEKESYFSLFRGKHLSDPTHARLLRPEQLTDEEREKGLEPIVIHGSQDLIPILVKILIGGMFVGTRNKDKTIRPPSIERIKEVPYIQGEFCLYDPTPLDDKGELDKSRHTPPPARCPKCYKEAPPAIVENNGVHTVGIPGTRFLMCAECFIMRLSKRVMFTRNEVALCKLIDVLCTQGPDVRQSITMRCWECREPLVKEQSSDPRPDTPRSLRYSSEYHRTYSKLKLKDRPFCDDCSGKYRLVANQCTMCYVRTTNVTALDPQGLRFCAPCIGSMIELMAANGTAALLEKERPTLRQYCSKHDKTYIAACHTCESISRGEERKRKKEAKRTKLLAARVEKEKKLQANPKAYAKVLKRREEAAKRRAIIEEHGLTSEEEDDDDEEEDDEEEIDESDESL